MFEFLKKDFGLVSVIIPCWNYGRYLKEAIDSCLDQSYKNKEIIVVNDASTDSTKEICKGYNNKIIYLENKKNRGVAFSRNKAIRASKGEFLAMLDADDIMLPKRIAWCLKEFEKDPSLGLVYGDAEIIDIKGKKIMDSPSPEFNQKELFKRNFIKTSSVMIRRECVEKVGLFDEKLHGPEDYDLWIRIVKKFKAKRIPKIIYKMRYHPDSLCWTSERNGSMQKQLEYIKWKHGLK